MKNEVIPRWITIGCGAAVLISMAINWAGPSLFKVSSQPTAMSAVASMVLGLIVGYVLVFMENKENEKHRRASRRLPS